MTLKLNDNAKINKVLHQDKPIHQWYRFVLSFPPHLVRYYLEKFSITKDHVVLDPFCGTGTTIVECKKLGIDSIGVEANPMLHFASKIKCDWSPDPELLFSIAKEISRETVGKLEEQNISDFPEFFNSYDTKIILKDLPPEKKRLVLKGSISSLPLHKALTLLYILDMHNPSYINHLKLAFARAVVEESSNLYFGPEVGVKKPKKDAPVVSSWLDCVNTIATDIELYKENKPAESDVILGDSRSISHYVKPHSIDFVFTSPPYPNEKDYTRITRLESVLLGFINTMDDLRKSKKGMLRSNTRNVYKNDDDDLYIRENKEIIQIADNIEKRRIELGKTSGFERQYSRVTKLYFGGMTRHLRDLRKILRPGAILAYVVGDQSSYLRIKIQTGKLLSQIAELLGYDIIDIELFRTRKATAIRENLNEEVVLLKWKG